MIGILSKYRLFFLVGIISFALSGCFLNNSANVNLPSSTDMELASIAGVNPKSGLVLLATGKKWSSVKSDSLVMPNASLAFTIYGANNLEELDEYVVISVSSLSSDEWLFGKGYFNTKPETINNLFWNSTIYPVYSDKDWYGIALKENGIITPPIMLAKRWSYSVNSSTKVVVEFRSVASRCVDSKKIISLQSELDSMLIECNFEVQKFNEKANQVIVFDEKHIIEKPIVTNFILPTAKPDIAKLIGEAIFKDRNFNLR